jgi:hypothetical protein
MNDNELFYLSYFLHGYWNQLGDEVHGDILGAAQAFFCEDEAYRSGLISDLKKAEQRGLLSNDYRDDVYEGRFWQEFQRVINLSDAQKIKNALIAG